MDLLKKEKENSKPNQDTDLEFKLRAEAEQWADQPERRQKHKLWLRPSHIDAYIAGALNCKQRIIKQEEDLSTLKLASQEAATLLNLLEDEFRCNDPDFLMSPHNCWYCDIVRALNSFAKLEINPKV
jgi:hypothetical protein